MPMVHLTTPKGTLDAGRGAALAERLTPVPPMTEGGVDDAATRSIARVSFDEVDPGDWAAGGRFDRAHVPGPQAPPPAAAGAPAPAPVTFYFEYASPYSYLATRLVDDVAARHGRGVRWRPIRLGDVLRRQGIAGDAPPAKIAYIQCDARRCAQLHGLAFAPPARFPPDAALARRAFYWLDALDPALARRFAHAVAGLCWGAGRDISTADDLAGVAEMLGVGRVGLSAALGDPGAARRLDEANAEAAALGCFGVPWFHADGESFFGHDRLPHLERFLAVGAGCSGRTDTAPAMGRRTPRGHAPP